MARRRHTPEQIVRKLKEADRMLNEGSDVAGVARHLQITETTYHRWRNQYGGMKLLQALGVVGLVVAHGGTGHANANGAGRQPREHFAAFQHQHADKSQSQ